METSKNCWVIPTDKPSKLAIKTNFLDGILKLHLRKGELFTNGVREAKCQHIYITSNEEIKEGDWIYGLFNGGVVIKSEFDIPKNSQYHKEYGLKIILTTDPDLIKDGVQAIDDDFLEWFVKNPSCETIEIKQNCNFPNCNCELGICGNGGNQKLYKIIIPKEELKSFSDFSDKFFGSIPKEEPNMVDKLKNYFKNTSKEQIQKDWNESCKQTEGVISPTVDEFLEIQEQFNKQETLEEASERINYFVLNGRTPFNNGFKEGAKWQQKRSYSEEEVNNIIMTLEEKFWEIIKKQQTDRPSECEKIADELAIGFAMSISTHCYCELGNDTRSYKELLEIYKKEKGL